MRVLEAHLPFGIATNSYGRRMNSSFWITLLFSSIPALMCILRCTSLLIDHFIPLTSRFLMVPMQVNLLGKFKNSELKCKALIWKLQLMMSFIVFIFSRTRLLSSEVLRFQKGFDFVHFSVLL